MKEKGEKGKTNFLVSCGNDYRHSLGAGLKRISSE
jgi:hypothetical protein